MSPRVDTTPNPLWVRDFVSDLKSAPETLSSWDNCMAKSYCKWPVIVAIIVGSVIVLSIVACIINCMCCGIQCCRCCGCCSCCCPSPRNKSPKYLDDPYNHPPPPMPPPSNPVYQPSPAPPVYRGQQQVARFDAPKSPTPKINEDALPAMPSWDSAVTRRVEDKEAHSDAMEMEPLNPANHEPRRMPSNPGPHGPNYMGLPPPVRTGTSSSYYPESRPYDDQSAYGMRSPGGMASPGPISPYDNQPYHDYTGGHPWQTPSPAPASYTPQPQYMAVGSAVTRAESPRPIPYRQPSPGFNQVPIGTAITRAETPRAVPYRQPSPGFNQMPGMAMSPSDGPRPIPYRQPTPGFTHNPVDRVMSPSIPSSPPPPFTATPAPHEMTSDPGRPPSLLQSGRKPAPNSYRNV
ncbi:hypothetical protein BJX96DRAFT_172588 [Aspergillus floccosus]